MLIRALLTLALLATTPARAVIVALGDGTQNTTAPADDFGWANVGLVQDTADGINVTGVYLGNGWVLSAYHGVRHPSGSGFQFGTALFQGITYGIDPSSAVRLINADQSLADLSLFRLTGLPDLPALEIATTAPASNQAVTMMGNGPNRATALTNWLVNPATNPYTWTEVPTGGNAQGYRFGAGQSLRWATNQVSVFGSGSTVSTIDDGFGITDVFRTTFNATAGEAQAGGGDSGGGVFWKVGGQWQLGGIMLFVATINGQPAGSAVFGNDTYAASLASYREQIVATVPEPGSSVLILLAAVPWLVHRRRRR